MISYPWATNLVYRAMGEDPPAPAPAARAGSPANLNVAGAPIGKDSRAPSGVSAAPDLDRVLDAARAFQPDWNILALRLPAAANAPVVVTLDRGDGGQPDLRGTLTLSAHGQVERWEGASSLTAGRRLRNFLRFAHTGEVAGLAGQTVAGMVSAAAAVLVYTGIALACRLSLSWSRRRAV